MSPFDTAESAALGAPPLARTVPALHGIPRAVRGLLGHLLGQVQWGSLVLELPGGQRLEARGEYPGAHASLRLHGWRPLLRLMVQGDLGLAESYRDGEWSTPDLTAVLLFGIQNEAHWGRALEGKGLAAWWTRLFHRLRANSRKGSRQNIAFHYDLGNDFYAQWLDAT